MPSATAQHHDQNFKADIVLGDRYGTSCNSDITALLEQSLRNSGYHVERNKPYAGGFITQHYGAPARGRHAIQIEINRALYMDETRLDLLSSFDELAGHLALACQNLCAFFNQSADHNRCYKAAE
jgi:N-formylglutamate amidohydrolase